MEFFCYHRDRSGSTPLRSRMAEEHWAYMDRFAATMIARGPTFTGDGTLTGSVHILDLPDAAAARAFAFEEPGYQAGAYRDVLLRRWRNSLGRTMWDFTGGGDETSRYLVLGFTEPTTDAVDTPLGDELLGSTARRPGARRARRRPVRRGRGAPVAVRRPAGLTPSRPAVEGRAAVGVVVDLPGGVVGAVVVERAEQLAVGEVGAAAV